MANIGRDGWSEIDWVIESAQNPAANHFNRFCDWRDYHQDLKSREAEAKKISSIRRQIGWSETGRLKRIASMPLHIFTILRRIDPEFATNTKGGKAKLLRFVQRHPMFSVR